jgi:hypothetical protein
MNGIYFVLPAPRTICTAGRPRTSTPSPLRWHTGAVRDYRVIIDFGHLFSGAEIAYDENTGQARLTVPFASRESAELAVSEIRVTVEDATKVINGQVVPLEIER